jgi:hypothetical protein
MSLTVSSSTIDGPAGTLYGPGAAGLLLRYTNRATSWTTGSATTSRTTGSDTSWADNCAIVLGRQRRQACIVPELKDRGREHVIVDEVDPREVALSVRPGRLDSVPDADVPGRQRTAARDDDLPGGVSGGAWDRSIQGRL